jgi:hypothetical protein
VTYSDGSNRKGWPAVVIDSSEGRDIFLAESGAVLRKILRMGYRFRALGRENSGGLLWVDSREGGSCGRCEI